MRRPVVGLLGLALVCGSIATGGAAASAVSTDGAKAPSAVSKAKGQNHDLPNPLEEKRRAEREAALQAVLDGTATPVQRGGSTVVDIGTAALAKPANAYSRNRSAGYSTNKTHNYVELARETTDKIFVILAEFGNDRDPAYPDVDSDPDTPGPTVFDGPLHNQIPKPAKTDNSTVWQKDSNQAFFQKMYFGTGYGVESLKTYYERQSSGRYSVDGTVSNWVKVKYNEARYGRNDCGDIVCTNTWALIRDAADQWVADQQAAGRSDADIAAELATFDQWDRYDADGDGNFNEPDGYIDHFQIVHAGGDEADGDPYQGEDAIWSHRWYAFLDGSEGDGPAAAPLGGTQIGETGVWIGDYTIQPENGGLSVFTHEYGHDLGLPDHYDTAGGGDNGVDWWTLMAQSRVWKPGDQGIGTRSADLSAWDKFQLGWLDYKVAFAGDTKTLKLGPHEYNTALPQSLIVVLPPKDVTIDLVPPKSGANSWWSGSGDDLNNTLTRSVAVPASPAATLTFQANWDIEDCGDTPCDYAYIEVDDGTGYKSLPAAGVTQPAENNGIDGTSGGAWVPASVNLSAYAGKTVSLRFRYATDGAVGGIGFFADDIAVTAGSTTVFSDDAESGDNGWTADGFATVGASSTAPYNHYYIASYRAYTSYDTYLKTGPYNFGFNDVNTNRVEHFPYQDGLLISYWDTSFNDNNKSEHPGEGLILPIDSHPVPLLRNDGTPWRGRVQVYDAPFSVQRTDALYLHLNSELNKIKSQKAQPVFDDSRTYWYAEAPGAGVKVPNAGVRIRVINQNKTTMWVKLTSTK